MGQSPAGRLGFFDLQRKRYTGNVYTMKLMTPKEYCHEFKLSPQAYWNRKRRGKVKFIETEVTKREKMIVVDDIELAKIK